MKAKKKFGQNFLIDNNVLDKISNSFLANENDLIIEIGPGMGALTKYLKKHNSFLIAYEIDVDMKKYLKDLEDNKTKIIYQDILKSNIKEDILDIEYNNLFIVGNLPYYITTPILENIVSQNIKFESLTIMIQKEVGERFMAKPGSKEYGYFTMYLNYYFKLEKIMDVSRKAFNPIPQVNSMVIKLIPKSKKLEKEKEYFEFLKKCFQNKRKTLKNNLLKEDFNKIIPILLKNNLSESVRAEEITEEVFIEIFKCISK